MMKIAGIMLVVAHTAGAAQGDDTDLQQIYTEAAFRDMQRRDAGRAGRGRMKLSRRTSDTSGSVCLFRRAAGVACWSAGTDV